jgi:tape measure domain-containing protein
MASDNIRFDVEFSAVGANTLFNEVLTGATGAKKALNDALGGKVVKELLWQIQVDESGAKKLVAIEKERYTAVDQLTKLQEKANSLQEGSVTSLRQQVNQAKQARDGMVKYASSTDDLNSKLQTVNGAWVVQNQRVKDLQKELNIASASNIWEKLAAEYNLGGLAAAGRQVSELVNVFQSVSIIVGQVIGSVNTLFDSLQKLQSIKLTFEGIGAGGEVSKVFSESSRIALGLGVSLNTVREAFQQLSPVVLATGGSMDDVSGITESLSSRFVTFGLSADKSRRVMNAVIQAFGKGKLMAEELTQQISEADPAFRTDLASAIGVTVQELNEMVKAGEITNSVLLEAIPLMGKSASLFGQLGNSALSAAQSFREGNVTVEQTRSQLNNLNQLNLEKLAVIFQPFLASIFEVTAVLVDFGTALTNSQGFTTFANFVNNLASQLSSVIQVAAKVVVAIGSITQPIFGAVNAIDGLTKKFVGFELIAGSLALLITGKLVVALGGLAVSGAVGAAIGGINAITAVIGLLNGGAMLNLIKTIGVSILAFVGLGKATQSQSASDIAAVATTKAREAASKSLTVQLIAQTVASTAAGKAIGAIPPFPPSLGASGAAALGGTATQIGNVAKATTEATAKTGAWSKALDGLKVAWSSLPKNPVAIVAATVALVVGGAALLAYNGLTKEAGIETKRFQDELKKIDANAKKATESLSSTTKGTDDFKERLANLQEQARSFKWTDLLPGPELWRNVRFDELIKGANQAYGIIEQRTKDVSNAVKGYNSQLDQSGIIGAKVAIQIGAAEQANQLLLDQTIKKRGDLIAEVERSGEVQSRETVAQLAGYDKVVQALEANKLKIQEIKAEAGGKGIVIDVTTVDAEKVITGITDKIKAAQAKITVTTDTTELQNAVEEVNGFKRLLDFIQQDPIQIRFDLQFEDQLAALESGLKIAGAYITNLQAQQELQTSLTGFAKSQLDYTLSRKEAEFSILKDRISGEQESLKTRIANDQEVLKNRLAQQQQQLKDQKASDEDILQNKLQGDAKLLGLKKAGEQEILNAKLAGEAKILAAEQEQKRIKEEKAQIEKDAILARAAALPAIQKAEQASLEITQRMALLELEQLQTKQEGAILEQKILGLKLEQQRLTTTDPNTIAILDLQIAKNKELEENLGLQLAITNQRISAQGVLNGIQQDTLTKQQQAVAVALQAEGAALGLKFQVQGVASAVDLTNDRLRVVNGQLSTQQQAVVGVINGVEILGSRWVPVNQSVQNVSGSLGVLTNQIKNAPAIDIKSEPLREDLEEAGAAAGGLGGAIGGASGPAGEISSRMGDASSSMIDGAGAAVSMAGSLSNGAGSADILSGSLSDGAGEAGRIVSYLDSIDGRTITVKVVGIEGRWAGGPTEGGQTYRINELGQEGFMTKSGKITPIRKPKNALWKAPSSGMVIPAHIMANLEAPSGKIKAKTGNIPIGGSGNQLAKIGRMIQAGNSSGSTASSSSSSALREMAVVQGYQAREIGKLSRAVAKLAEKDWNVNVGVRNTGGTAYLDALNRRM